MFMNLSRLIFLLVLTPLTSRAAVLEVGQGEAYTTIQAAISAASPGDTVRVEPGLYAENVVIDKSPLTLEGAKASTPAAGRIIGSANAAVETVIAPVAGAALTLSHSTGIITVSGFAFAAAGNPSGGVVETLMPAGGLVFRNNDVRVASGATACALYLGHDCVDATFSGNVFLAAANSPAAVEFAAGAAFHGLLFEDNSVQRAVSGALFGIRAVGGRQIGPSLLRVPVFSGNTISGQGTGFLCGTDSLREAVIIDNLFTGNQTGFSGGPGACHFRGNTFQHHQKSGLFLTGLGALPDSGANVIEENTFSGNAIAPVPPAADIHIAEDAGSIQLTNAVSRNRLLSAKALIIEETAGAFDAGMNFWGEATGPKPGQISAAGGAVFTPFYTDAGLTELSFGESPVTGDFAVPSGATLSGNQLTLDPAATLSVPECSSVSVQQMTLLGGASVRVERGSIETGLLTLEPGAVLDVISGDLSLQPAGAGGFHTISGTFSFYDCLGSVFISGNTTFSGVTLGLVSDVHVAPGVTLLVTGSLTLDGCTVDSTGNYNVVVNPGAEFNLVRSQVTGAYITVAADDVEIYDNTLTATSITVISFVSGPQIYHNILTGGTFLFLLPGSTVTTSRDGWGNVAAANQVRNAMELRFREPANPTRTLDSAGNLYVQPGDALAAGMDAGYLFDPMQAAEVILGFNSTYVSFSNSTGSADWFNTLFEASELSGVIGRINSVTGLGFAWPDSNGTTQSGPIADFNLQALTQEGRTRFFFQRKSTLDHPLIQTRYTASSGGAPYYREFPYTANSPLLTIDGTPPVFGPSATAVQIQGGTPVDVTQTAVTTLQGTVTVTFDAMDALAGVDDVDVGVVLDGIAGTVSGTLAGTSIVNLSGTDFTRYVFEIPITALTPNGTYNIDATVMDRSGNVATLGIGALQVLKNQIAVTVQPQGLISGPVTRQVVFTATNGAGVVLATWSPVVNFTGGTGSALLTAVPDGTVYLSAKMAWNLRTRLAAGLDVNGQASVAFMGAAQLRGGDFNADNLINLADYNIMRAVFPSAATVPDISGDGQTTLTDYNIFRLNWLTIGDPL